MKQIFVLSAVLWLLSCSFEDSERCPDGYDWIADYKMCIQEGALDADADSDTDTEPGETPETEENGVGVSCLGDTDCAELEADWCLLDPFNASAPGMCSVFGCVAADCEGTGYYACCDCTSVVTDLIETSEPFCVPVSRLLTLEGLGCICGEGK